MNVFELRDRLISDYSGYVNSFIEIRDDRVKACVDAGLKEGVLWPDPRIALNPAFQPGAQIDELVEQGILHSECSKIFRAGKDAGGSGSPLRLHKHQVDAIHAAKTGGNYVLTTGTGSGKSLAYIVPIVDAVLRAGSGRGIKAIVVYPMNALANSQKGELEKFLCHGYPDLKGPVTFQRYTGQEREDEKKAIIASPPDILLTNYVMLELLLTRVDERNLVAAAKGLNFLVLDELHTYRGRQGADVAMLVRRVREACQATSLQCIGTSATLASPGSYDQQKSEVARVAGLLFGGPVTTANVIGETLRRATPEAVTTDHEFLTSLKKRLADLAAKPPVDYPAFVSDPLSSWIEGAFGITTDAENGRLVRAVPRTLSGHGGAAGDLAEATALDEQRCAAAIKAHLLAGYKVLDPDTGFPVFAFRLHQFISRGESVYATPEPESNRHITLYEQTFVPGDRSRVLLPLVFCRECGQEYYSVTMTTDDAGPVVTARPFGEKPEDEADKAGYLYLSESDPWPSAADELIDKLPEDWLEDPGGVLRVRAIRKKDLPQQRWIKGDGHISSAENVGVVAHFVPSPFRFCLACGVSYVHTQRSDFTKLTTLGSGGRSTATTILTMSAISSLRRNQDLPAHSRKLLSFTDNRQDASLQAGHFNDFIEIGLLRSALYRAVREAGADGLSHEVLTQQVFTVLDLPVSDYAADRDVRFQALSDTQRGLRDVLGYRLYLDLRRGWRVTSPNLEQCGLLEITYDSLDDVCAAEDVWAKAHPALAGASPATRQTVAKTLLDYMRRELAIKVNYLEEGFQETLAQVSSQRLIPPWALDENEQPQHATVLVPRSSRKSDYGGWVYLSPRGGFGQYLGRRNTFSGYPDRLDLDAKAQVAGDLLEGLRVAGLVEVVKEAKGPDEVPGYQVPAAAMRWRAGDGTKAFHDPVRVPRPPAEGGRTNPYFREFYDKVAIEAKGLQAREHTAQVPYEQREEREEQFREARLPILFCSPTMELGVDIAALNVVNMRNVPPTPANYAQRSGRAGRSGQPALVFTYCSTGSSHDQWFFRRPELMVSGQVAPPRLDVANEDLIRAHVHAVWLAESGLGLGRSLKDLLDLSGEAPSLALLDSKRNDVENSQSRIRAQDRSQHLLASIAQELEESDWYSPTWLPDTISAVGQRFEAACERWRGLYRAALTQSHVQHKIILDASRPEGDKKQAKRLRREAEAQLDLLTAETDRLWQSDFYSYRYFAGEGFLPGYSFPRLPLSAFIPGRASARGTEEFLSRPRFLAISEFGPRSFLYHEGSRYIINKVILPVGDLADPSGEQPALTRSAKQCEECGYLHPMIGAVGPDLCERCNAALPGAINDLFRLQNVSTKRRDRINSDEEERQRQGYELRTGVRFAQPGGRQSVRTAEVDNDGQALARLSYGQSATLWRMNMGWRRSTKMGDFGFVLDAERGYWATKKDAAADEDPADPMSPRTIRVIPFVEDQRNCLLLEPVGDQPTGKDGLRLMASLQAALKSAIQVTFQLEDSELAAEPLPGRDDRRLLLLYESAEGGAGVLRRLIDDPDALPSVAKTALDLCHFHPESGEDLRHAPGAAEPCEAACYDCLMSYTNQTDHLLLDRQLIKPFLMDLATGKVLAAPGTSSRPEHLQKLMNLAGSELERRWLRFMNEGGYRLPAMAQFLVEDAHTRPDFCYDTDCVAVYIDGPVHAYPDRAERDTEKQSALEDMGYTVLRFRHDEQWQETVDKYPSVFGKGE